MRKTGVWLSLLAMVVCAGSASAISTDGSWTDWFTYHGNVGFSNWQQGNYTLTNGNIRTQADEEGPTPGGGGQPFDIEEIFYFFEDFDNNDDNSGGILHVGLVTGFPSGGAQNLYAGDLFIGFGAGVGYNDVAVAVGTENTAANDFGARFGSAWFNSGAPNWTLESVNVPAHVAASDPYRVDEDNSPGAVDISGSATVAWGGQGVHNFLEVALVVGGAQELLLTDDQNGGIGLHWTMQCGNDEIDVEDDTPFAPVPEPATMVLLGMGVLGIALRARRPRC